MTRTLHLLPRAEAELADAMDWYEERREGLGGELLELARATFERILEAPDQLPSWVGDRQYRRLVLERFPTASSSRSTTPKCASLPLHTGDESPGIGTPSRRNAGSATGLLQRARFAAGGIEHARGEFGCSRDPVLPSRQNLDG